MEPKTKIPTKKECLRLMETYNMLPNIKKHSQVVCKVALTIAKELNKKGESLDLKKIEAAALLHDIAKTGCLFTKKDHAKEGARLLNQLGLKEIAKIVERHIFLPTKRILSKSLSEEEIINYADKRVRHWEIVSLEERFKDLEQRYGIDKSSLQRIRRLKKSTELLEKKIFSRLDLDPLELKDLIKKKM